MPLMRFPAVILLLTFYNLSLHAQNSCDPPADKKHQKSLEEAKSAKQELSVRIQKLSDLSEELPDNAVVWFELGRLRYKSAEKKEVPDYTQAGTCFETAVQLCPEINPQAYHYLGLIHYMNENYEAALSSFKQFLKFGENPADKDHFTKLEDVRRSIPIIQLEADKKAGKVPPGVLPQKVMEASTSKSEYLPMLSPDNSLLFFTRKSEKLPKGGVKTVEAEEFVQAARKGEPMLFEEGLALKAPFNMGANYGGVTLSLNNREMFITVCMPDSAGYKNCDIYSSYYVMEKLAQGGTGYMWSDLKPLDKTINGADTWEAQPCISPDGKTLYFTRYGKSTQQTDLYYTTREKNGPWSEAKPLTALNTDGHEKAAFMHQDGRTLYFSCSSRGGLGGFDIFMSRMDEKGNWSNPLNIGVPVNTRGDEHGLLVSTDGKYGVYAANTETNPKDYDLFYFELPQDFRPEDILMVKGKVENADEQTKVQLKKSNGETLKEIELDQDDGGYATVLRKKDVEQPVLLTIEQEGAAFNARLIDPATAAHGVLDHKDLENQKLSENHPYTIYDIYFETNKAVLSSKSILILNEFAGFLKKNGALKVLIQGHTDNIGSDEDNLVLSNARAKAVLDYLLEQGIDKNRLGSKGYGASQPVADNNTEAGRAKNRRTEFVVLK